MEGGWSTLFGFGLSHRVADVSIRERFALTGERKAGLRITLAGDDELGRGVLVSTCNRTELYGVLEGKRTFGEPLRTELSALVFPQLGPAANPYLHEGWDAVFHLFRVASGLDSMVIGESEILRQVKEAFEEAHDQGATARVVQDLFRSALVTGKRVRTETQLGEGSLSVAATAVRLAKKVLGDLADKVAVVIGAGETGELSARHLVANGVRRTIVLNRSPERAAEVAARLGCAHDSLAALRGAIEEADLVIGAVEAPEPVLRREILKGLSGRTRCLIDISVPRSIDPAVSSVAGVFAFDIDDLKSIISASEGERLAQVEVADAIVADEVEKFLARQAYVELTPTVRELQDGWRGMVDEALGRSAFDERARSEIDKLTRRLLGLSMEALKSANRRRIRKEEIEAAYAAFKKRNPS